MNRETPAGKATVSQLCAVFGLSRQAYYQALPAPPTETAPEPPPTRGSRWVTAEEASNAIWPLADAHPSWGVRKIWACLKRDGLCVSRKRVWALMRSMRLCVPAERRARRPMDQVTVPESNRRWATDMTTVWTRRDKWVAVMPVVDCGDRVLLALEASKSQTALSLLAPVEHSLERVFGQRKNVPEGLELRTDHSPQYTGVDCDQMCWRCNSSTPSRPSGAQRETPSSSGSS